MRSVLLDNALANARAGWIQRAKVTNMGSLPNSERKQVASLPAAGTTSERHMLICADALVSNVRTGQLQGFEGREYVPQYAADGMVLVVPSKVGSAPDKAELPGCEVGIKQLYYVHRNIYEFTTDDPDVMARFGKMFKDDPRDAVGRLIPGGIYRTKCGCSWFDADGNEVTLDAINAMIRKCNLHLIKKMQEEDMWQVSHTTYPAAAEAMPLEEEMDSVMEVTDMINEIRSKGE